MTLSVLLPVYNDRGLAVVESLLRPSLRPGDRFVVFSGNAGRLDTAWLIAATALLRATFPENTVIAATSGLANLAKVARDAPPFVHTVGYDYEPAHTNEPEFTWDFAQTRAVFARAASLAQAHGRHIIGIPTGQPLTQTAPRLGSNWSYGSLGAAVTGLVIQTQAVCKRGTRHFDQALAKIERQYAEAGTTSRWFPQVTVNPAAPNGVSAARAAQCVKLVAARGLPGVMIWWSPASPQHVAALLRRMRSAA